MAKAKRKKKKKKGSFIVSDSDDEHSTKKKKRESERQFSVMVLVNSPSLQVGLLFQVDWYRVIIDEAQNIRNRRTSALLAFATTALLIVLHRDFSFGNRFRGYLPLVPHWVRFSLCHI
jgi:ribosomal protein L35